MHARIATYRLKAADPYEVAAKAERGMLPIFRSQPGFQAYSLVVSQGELGSLSTWETADQAESATTAASVWVRENLSNDVELIDLRVGEVLLSTALGLSALQISS
ncbi:MAG TPA: hypothetical protein VF379_01640 [Gaiellaceae bacterium]